MSWILNPRSRPEGPSGQKLSELHGVERRSLSQIVAHRPQVDATRISNGFTDPPDEHIV